MKNKYNQNRCLHFGSSLVEFAIAIPLVVMLLVLAADIARIAAIKFSVKQGLVQGLRMAESDPRLKINFWNLPVLDSCLGSAGVVLTAEGRESVPASPTQEQSENCQALLKFRAARAAAVEKAMKAMQGMFTSGVAFIPTRHVDHYLGQSLNTAVDSTQSADGSTGLKAALLLPGFRASPVCPAGAMDCDSNVFVENSLINSNAATNDTLTNELKKFPAEMVANFKVNTMMLGEQDLSVRVAGYADVGPSASSTPVDCKGIPNGPNVANADGKGGCCLPEEVSGCDNACYSKLECTPTPVASPTPTPTPACRYKIVSTQKGDEEYAVTTKFVAASGALPAGANTAAQCFVKFDKDCAGTDQLKSWSAAEISSCKADCDTRFSATPAQIPACKDRCGTIEDRTNNHFNDCIRGCNGNFAGKAANLATCKNRCFDAAQAYCNRSFDTASFGGAICHCVEPGSGNAPNVNGKVCSVYAGQARYDTYFKPVTDIVQPSQGCQPGCFDMSLCTEGYYYMMAGPTGLNNPNYYPKNCGYHQAFEDRMQCIFDKLDNSRYQVESSSSTTWLDGDCNVINSPSGTQYCGEIDISWSHPSPISLVWDEKALTEKTTIVSFPLDPNAKGKWYGWKASSGLPLLVFDPEHKGEIKDGSQLFGSFTFGKNWKDGYAALASLDKNGDGKISGAELEPLALWFDAQQDGEVQAGEVKTLKELNITALYFKPDVKDPSGTEIKATHGFDRTIFGHKAHGASIDWFVAEYDNKESAATVTDPSHVTASAAIDASLSGAWSWETKEVNTGNSTGVLFLQANGGIISGRSLLNVSVVDNATGETKKMAVALPLSGKVVTAASGPALELEVQTTNGNVTKSFVTLGDNGQTLNGRSKAFRAKDQVTNDQFVSQYSWVAKKIS